MFKPFGKTFALIALSAATLTACKKDKDETMTVSAENLVGTYTLTAIKEKIGDDDEVNTTSDYIEDCQKDDEIILKSNMTYTYNDAGTECEPSKDDSGDWEFDADTKGVYIVQLNVDGEVEKFTSSELIIREYFDQGGFKYSKRYFFNRK